MNPNMMNRNVCYYGANRNRTNNCNTGNCSTGNCNAGNCNTGNCNTGNCNTSNRSAGNCNTNRCNMPMQERNENTNCGCMNRENMPTQERNRNTNCCRTNRENMPMQERNGNTNCGCTNRENMACNNYMEVDRRQLECMNQHQLLNYLNQVSFSMYDTTLFLDTHPCNRKAMAYFNEMKHARMLALEIYEKKFGPLLLDNVDADCEWTWGMQSLPWEPMC